MRVAALIGLAAAALALALPAAGAPPPTKRAGELRVALAMPAAGFQVGSVRGRTVVFARGFEIDLARELARRLELRRVQFVNEALFSKLLAPGEKDWDVALAEITVTPERARQVDFSRSYLQADQGVLVRIGLPRAPRSIGDLRALRLCAERASTGAALVVERIRPARKPLLVSDPSRLSYALFRKRCDAIVADAPALAVLRAQAPDRYGALAGRIATRERWAVAFEQGSRLRTRVNRALAAMERDGTLKRIRERWLGEDTAALPVLK